MSRTGPFARTGNCGCSDSTGTGCMSARKCRSSTRTELSCRSAWRASVERALNGVSPSMTGMDFHMHSAAGTSPDGTAGGEEHLRSILATVPDAMVIIDEAGSILSFSAAAEKMFGYTQREVIGENVSMLMPSPDRERHDGYLRNYAETGVPKIIGIGRVTTARHRGGNTFPIELSVGEAWIDEK